jgi:hypothetical protein
VLEIVVHRSVRKSDITVSDTLNSDNFPKLFHIVYHIRARDILAPVEIHVDWERLRSRL